MPQRLSSSKHCPVTRQEAWLKELFSKMPPATPPTPEIAFSMGEEWWSGYSIDVHERARVIDRCMELLGASPHSAIHVHVYRPDMFDWLPATGTTLGLLTVGHVAFGYRTIFTTSRLDRDPPLTWTDTYNSMIDWTQGHGRKELEYYIGFLIDSFDSEVEKCQD